MEIIYSILFDAYLTVPDAEFNGYLKSLYNDCMDQVGKMKNIKFEQLT